MFRKNEKPMQIKIQLTPDEVKRAVIDWLENRDEVSLNGGPVPLNAVRLFGDDDSFACEVTVDAGDQS